MPAVAALVRVLSDLGFTAEWEIVFAVAYTPRLARIYGYKDGEIVGPLQGQNRPLQGVSIMGSDWSNNPGGYVVDDRWTSLNGHLVALVNGPPGTKLFGDGKVLISDPTVDQLALPETASRSLLH